MKNTQCIIFDMDGVIVNTEPLHKKAYYQTFRALDIRVTDTLYQTLTGSSTINTFQKLVHTFDLHNDPKDLVLQKRSIYVDLFENDPSLQLIEGVLDIIQYFHRNGYILVLASSSAMENINRVFTRFNLDQYFIGKVSGADLQSSKPHPEIFEKAAAMANIAVDNCVVIEDSDNGITAANAAGTYSVGYRSEASSMQTLQEAQITIEHFNMLKQYL
jgi:HAD superfamily hydrolase (TIGR01509 family)